MSLPRRPRVVPGLDLLSLSISGRGKSADGEVVGSGERSSERRVDVIAGGGISPASSPASSLPSSSSSPDRDLGFAEAEGAESARRSKLRVVIGNVSSEGGEPDYFEASIGSPVDSLCSDDFFGDRSVTSNEAFSARRSSHSGRLMSEIDSREALSRELRLAMKNTFDSLLDAFRAFDEDMDGRVVWNELRLGILKLKIGMSEEQVEKMFNMIQESGTGDNWIDYGGFCGCFGGLDGHRASKLRKKNWEVETEKEIREVLKGRFGSLVNSFRFFDKNGDGKIGTMGQPPPYGGNEMMAGLQSLNLGLSVKHIKRLVHRCDTDGDGYIDYGEFVARYGGREGMRKIEEREDGWEDELEDEIRIMLRGRYHKCQKAFNRFDSNNDGRLTVRDMKHALLSLGLGIRVSDVKVVWERLDRDLNGWIDSGRFKQYFSISEKSRMGEPTVDVGSGARTPRSSRPVKTPRRLSVPEDPANGPFSFTSLLQMMAVPGGETKFLEDAANQARRGLKSLHGSVFRAWLHARGSASSYAAFADREGVESVLRNALSCSGGVDEISDVLTIIIELVVFASQKEAVNPKDSSPVSSPLNMDENRSFRSKYISYGAFAMAVGGVDCVGMEVPESVEEWSENVRLATSSAVDELAAVLAGRYISCLSAFLDGFDVGGDCKIWRKSFKTGLKYLGVDVTVSMSDWILSKVDSDMNGFIDYGEFTDWLSRSTIAPSRLAKSMAAGMNEEVADEVRLTVKGRFDTLSNAFKQWDADKDNIVSFSELRTALGRLGLQLSQQHITDIINSADRNGDGSINYSEFKRHFKYRPAVQRSVDFARSVETHSQPVACSPSPSAEIQESACSRNLADAAPSASVIDKEALERNKDILWPRLAETFPTMSSLLVAVGADKRGSAAAPLAQLFGQFIPQSAESAGIAAALVDELSPSGFVVTADLVKGYSTWRASQTSQSRASGPSVILSKRGSILTAGQSKDSSACSTSSQTVKSEGDCTVRSEGVFISKESSKPVLHVSEIGTDEPHGVKRMRRLSVNAHEGALLVASETKLGAKHAPCKEVKAKDSSRGPVPRVVGKRSSTKKIVSPRRRVVPPEQSKASNSDRAAMLVVGAAKETSAAVAAVTTGVEALKYEAATVKGAVKEAQDFSARVAEGVKSVEELKKSVDEMKSTISDQQKITRLTAREFKKVGETAVSTSSKVAVEVENMLQGVKDEVRMFSSGLHDGLVSTNSAADAAVSARRAVEGLEHVLTKVETCCSAVESMSTSVRQVASAAAEVVREPTLQQTNHGDLSSVVESLARTVDRLSMKSSPSTKSSEAENEIPDRPIKYTSLHNCSISFDTQNPASSIRHQVDESVKDTNSDRTQVFEHVSARAKTTSVVDDDLAAEKTSSSCSGSWHQAQNVSISSNNTAVKTSSHVLPCNRQRLEARRRVASRKRIVAQPPKSTARTAQTGFQRLQDLQPLSSIIGDAVFEGASSVINSVRVEQNLNCATDNSLECDEVSKLRASIDAAERMLHKGWYDSEP